MVTVSFSPPEYLSPVIFALAKLIRVARRPLGESQYSAEDASTFSRRMFGSSRPSGNQASTPAFHSSRFLAGSSTSVPVPVSDTHVALTGRFVGFLPDHYAAPLVQRGTLRALRPDLISLNTPFNLILRHDAPRSPLVKAFATALGVDLKQPL